MSTTGLKAVAIDNMNLLGCRGGLHIPKINYRGLMWVIQKQIGLNLPLCPQPMSTLQPDWNRRGHALFDDMHRAGIETVSATCHNSADDLVVANYLQHFAKNPDVKILVVVSCDHYLIEEALRLARARRVFGRPLSVYVVGTLALEEGGHARINHHLVEALHRSSTAAFVDLQAHVSHIAAR